MPDKSQPLIDIVKLGLQELMKRQSFPEESAPAGSIIIETGPLMRAIILIEGEAGEHEPGWTNKNPTACIRSVGPGSGIGLEYFADDSFYPLIAVAKTDVRYSVVDWDTLKEATPQPGILMQHVGLILRSAGSDLQKQRMASVKLLADHAIAEEALAHENAERVRLQTKVDELQAADAKLKELEKELATSQLIRRHQQILVETLQATIARLQSHEPELETRVEKLETRVETQEQQIQKVRTQSAEQEMQMKLLGETLPKLVGNVPPLKVLELLIPLFESMMDSRNDALIEAGKGMMSALYIANTAIAHRADADSSN